MKLKKSTGRYEASNVTYDPVTKEAFSYRWWRFVGVVEGKLIFNNHRYSNTTSKHQQKVLGLLQELNVKPDLFLPLPEGIQIYSSLQETIETAEEFLCNKFLEAELKKQERNEKQREKRALVKLVSETLENSFHFRDYVVTSKKRVYDPEAYHQRLPQNAAAGIFEVCLDLVQAWQKSGKGKLVVYV